MNIALWVVQIILAALYAAAGSLKTFATAKARKQLPWTAGRSDAFVHFVGISELLGAVGLILPMLTNILPWLTPLAAAGLALIQVLAIVTVHLPQNEYKVLSMNVILLALALFILFGRLAVAG